jgi:hypothetical protein
LKTESDAAAAAAELKKDVARAVSDSTLTSNNTSHFISTVEYYVNFLKLGCEFKKTLHAL